MVVEALLAGPVVEATRGMATKLFATVSGTAGGKGSTDCGIRSGAAWSRSCCLTSNARPPCWNSSSATCCHAIVWARFAAALGKIRVPCCSASSAIASGWAFPVSTWLSNRIFTVLAGKCRLSLPSIPI